MNDLRKTTGPMRQALKAAVRRALLLAGGGDSVQYATRVKSPALSRYASSQEEHQDNHCPIDVATDLDLEAGQPVILETMARAQGYRLERIEPAQYAEIPWPQKQGMISRTVGELTGIIGDALADGRIDRQEASVAREKIREQIQQLQRLDARIEAEACDGPVVRMTGVAR